MKPDGTLYAEGDIMKRPKLAETLDRIAENGGDEFYTGSLANDVIADLQDIGM